MQHFNVGYFSAVTLAQCRDKWQCQGDINTEIDTSLIPQHLNISPSISYFYHTLLARMETLNRWIKGRIRERKKYFLKMLKSKWIPKSQTFMHGNQKLVVGKSLTFSGWWAAAAGSRRNITLSRARVLSPAQRRPALGCQHQQVFLQIPGRGKIEILWTGVVTVEWR